MLLKHAIISSKFKTCILWPKINPCAIKLKVMQLCGHISICYILSFCCIFFPVLAFMASYPTMTCYTVSRWSWSTTLSYLDFTNQSEIKRTVKCNNEINLTFFDYLRLIELFACRSVGHVCWYSRRLASQTPLPWKMLKNF